MNPQNKKDISFVLKRTLFLSPWAVLFAPGILFYIYTIVFPSVNYDDYYSNPYFQAFFVVYLVFAVIYSFLVTHFNLIERSLRVMSQKDDMVMDPSVSFDIVKKIFKATLKFKWLEFLRYYSRPCLVIFGIIVLVFSMFMLVGFDSFIQALFLYLFFGFFFAIIFAVYLGLYLRAKTRYVWFTYLGHFGDSFSELEIFEEAEKVSSIKGFDGVKKAMLGYFKRDVVAEVGSTGVNTVIENLMPKNILTDMVQGYTRLAASNTAEYSKTKLDYEKYKTVYFELYGKNPEPSLSLFSSR